jgi:hypothetical protein
MTRLRTGLLPVVLLLPAVLAAGCGTGVGSTADGASTPSAVKEGDSGEEADGGEQVGTPQTVECPGDATQVDLPADFPAPLPEGTVVVAVQERDGGRTVVTGSVPRAEADVLAALQAAYPAAGLRLTDGETEERDAESNFVGDDVVGRWGVRELSDCSPEATRIDLVVGPA